MGGFKYVYVYWNFIKRMSALILMKLLVVGVDAFISL